MLQAPIEPGSIIPVSGACVLGRGRLDGPGPALNLDASALQDLIGGAGGAVTMSVIIASGDYTPPTGTKTLLCIAQGAGGGGAFSGESGAAGGGGAGCAFIGLAPVAAWGEFPLAIVIGAGGVVGTEGTPAGGDGGGTTVGSVLTVGGGFGGSADVGAAAGGAHGIGSVDPGISGRLLLGGNGAPGISYDPAGTILRIGGAGGASLLGGAGAQTLVTTGTPAMDGDTAGFGCGGSGAASTLTEGGSLGGHGGEAIVIFLEFKV